MMCLFPVSCCVSGSCGVAATLYFPACVCCSKCLLFCSYLSLRMICNGTCHSTPPSTPSTSQRHYDQRLHSALVDSRQSLTTPPVGSGTASLSAGGVPQHYDVIQEYTSTIALLEEEIGVLLAENERWATSGCSMCGCTDTHHCGEMLIHHRPLFSGLSTHAVVVNTSLA